MQVLFIDERATGLYTMFVNDLRSWADKCPRTNSPGRPVHLAILLDVPCFFPIFNSMVLRHRSSQLLLIGNIICNSTTSMKGEKSIGDTTRWAEVGGREQERKESETITEPLLR